MLKRDAGKLALVFVLAHCGGESEFDGLGSVPVPAPVVDVEDGAQRHEGDKAERAVEAPAPALADSNWQATVSRRIAASRFLIEPRGERFEAQNPEHGFRASFDAAGVRLEQREGSGKLRIGGSALGRGENRTPLEPASLQLGACRADGALDAMGKCLQRLEATRGKVTELWENREDGLEHSFIVHERSEGVGELSVSVSVENAKVTIDAGGTSARIAALGTGQSYRYAGLRAWDARGTVLPARMQAQPGGLSLVVDDANAAYPITIDPVLAIATWTTEADSGVVRYGESVAGAGDVNNDGFDDVLVAARSAQSSGTAYLYLGTAAGLLTNAAWQSAPINADTNVYTTVVAGAGDVNHDGFDDVIVGSPGFSNGQTREGRAAVYHGGLGGLAALPAWTAESNLAEARLGSTVAGAGDVNGDGFDDIIVANLGASSPGQAFVYHGGPSGLAASAAWTRVGVGASTAMAGAGDVNGDGFDDILLGFSAAGVSEGLGHAGRTEAYFGSAQGLSPVPSWLEDGGADDMFGHSVAGAGDLNGDGFGDFIVGAPGGLHISFPDTFDTPGYAAVYLGSNVGPFRFANLAGPDFEAPSNDFGFTVAGAGDVNGDGFDDVLVNNILWQTGAMPGKAIVYHGSANGLVTTPAWSSMHYLRNSFTDFYAIPAAGAGDVDGDGFSDIIVGAPFVALPPAFDPNETSGMAFVFNGSPTGLPGPVISTAESNQASSRFGVSVANAGDVNADGFDDVIVGAPRFDNGQTDEGRAFVYHGTVSGIGTSATWTAESNQASAQFGSSVSGAGDINGDGFDDVIIGAPLFDNGQTNEGRVFVYHGGPAGLTTFAWSKESNQAEARFGASVASAGDVNHDGFDDVMIGAPRFDNGQTDEGRAFVYTGRAVGLGPSPVWTGESNQADANYGVCVASAGDVNGDGFGDVIVGADFWDGAQIDAGRAYVYHGRLAGLASVADWTTEGSAGSAWGRAAAGVGDVNGDGFDDVIVTTPAFNNNKGYIRVFRGGNAGLQTSSPGIFGTHTDNEFFGQSVTGAGDINGDGYDDFVVGAYGFSEGEFDEGAAFVYFGVPANDVTEFPLAFVIEANQASAGFGVSVASGDVNGDGLGDLIVGAHYFDNGQTNEGRVFVVH